MTKPTRTDPTDNTTSECPPIRGPQPRGKMVVTESHLNHIAFYLASGMTVAKAAKDLALSEDRVRHLYVDSRVIAIAEELSADMKKYFIQKSEAFVQRIMDAAEEEHIFLAPQTRRNNEERIEIRDAVFPNGDYKYACSTRLDAMKQIDNRYDASEKVGLSIRDKEQGKSFTIVMPDLSKLIAQDTGKIVDITPSTNGEVR